MLQQPESACFVIADISGYTGYLAGVELDHAQDILADLIDTVVRALRPPFRLAKLEGDAAFVYVLTEKVDGSLLQDSIEATYFAFRRRLRNIKQSSVCECNACRRMPTLDLKFVVHHGEMAKQRMAGREELVGRDVILIHRLLKNSVADKVGNRAYALYTDACVQAMAIDPPVQGLVEHTEIIDIIGEVKAWLRDLEAAWQAEDRRPHQMVSVEDAFRIYTAEVAAPRPAAWEFVTAPGHRPKWQGSDAVIENAANGRRGLGTKNHCMHGKDAMLEEYIDWRPFDLATLTFLMPMPGAPKILMTYVFSDRVGGGTRVELRVAKPKPKDRPFFDQNGAMFDASIEGSMTRLKLMLQDMPGSQPAIEEPKLPTSGERFLTQPVRSPAP